MDYNINDFVTQLRKNMYSNFPYLEDRGKNHSGSYKHGQYNDEIRDVAFMKNQIQVISDNMIVFDIGNEYAEKYYPYYHILEDAPVIRKRDKGDKRTKGSQAEITNLSERDYGKISFNGKTYSQEYRKVVNKKRKIANADNVTEKYVNGKKITLHSNEGANSYTNKHYHYIENMIIKAIPFLESYFNITYKSSKNNGLMEEYTMQEHSMPSDEMATVMQVLGM